MDSIVLGACSALGELGVAGLTVGTVAERAGVSTALVHYHFDTKARLLAAAARRLAAERLAARRRTLSRAKGLALLDDLWSTLAAAADDGTERAWLELSLIAPAEPGIGAELAAQRQAERALFAARLPTLLDELGTTSLAGQDELTQLLAAALDGFVAALLTGARESAVRAAYDAFWLTLIAAGQAARS